MKLQPGYYTSPRWTGEILDCSMPMTFDTYSNCAFQCVYCFSFFQRAVNKGADDYLTHKVKSVNVDRVKRMFTDPDQYAHSFAWYIKDRITMQWGGLSDGFDHYEKKFGKSLELLRFFREIEYPISISTKGVWWIYDDRYRELLEGAPNIHVKVTIITADHEAAKKLEAGTPSPRERFDGMAELTKLGIPVTLRFRPYIIGVSDRTMVECFTRAAKVGAFSVSTEFLCMEARSINKARARYDMISEVAGMDVWQFYRLHSAVRSGYLRLNYDTKRPYVEEMKETAEILGLELFVSDAHHKEKCAWGSCCGIPKSWRWSRGQFTEAILIAKEKGEVRWSDLDEAAQPLKNIPIEHIHEANTLEKAQRRFQTMYDYVREHWSKIESFKSPARYFGGALVPTGVDEHGDVIYTYNEAYVDDGLRIMSVEEIHERAKEGHP